MCRACARISRIHTGELSAVIGQVRDARKKSLSLSRGSSIIVV